MIGHVKVRERGPTPRGMAKELNAIKKKLWNETGVFFHRTMLPLRFTKAGGRKLKYAKRKGEGIPKGSPRYARSYTGRKERTQGHTDPLVYSGESKQLARIRDVRSTSKGAKVVLQARKLNFKHPKSRIRMNVEVRRVATDESETLAEYFDARLDERLARIQTQTTTTV